MHSVERYCYRIERLPLISARSKEITDEHGGQRNQQKSLNHTYLNEFTKSNLYDSSPRILVVIVYRIDNLSFNKLFRNVSSFNKASLWRKSLPGVLQNEIKQNHATNLSLFFPPFLVHTHTYTYTRALSLSPSIFITHLCCCWNFQSFV